MRLEIRPRRLTRVCWAVAVLVVVVFGVIAVLLPGGTAAAGRTGVGDQVAFFVLGLLLAAAVLLLVRARVRADAQGIWVRNVLGERFFPWAVVVSVDLPDGASWAQLELHDDETVALLAVQSNDGEAAVDAVVALRGLLKAARDTPS
jgi:membrane protease YdiL (CAAX protease family)